MASVQSLGLHEPSALPYLIAESVLPPEPSQSQYDWNYWTHIEESKLITDEVLTTSHCAVWSRSGSIKRVFNLDIEGEFILQAFVTRFAPNVQPEGTRRLQSNEPALVVILRTQAHIFLLAGDVHVVPLSFEVREAFPCARGFILQRRPLRSSTNDSDFRHPWARDVSSDISVDSIGKPVEPSFAIPGITPFPERSSTASKSPSTFSFTELLSELGVVVTGSTRNNERLEICNALPSSEEIVYVSASDELEGLDTGQTVPLYLAITINASNSTLNLFQIVFDQTASDLKKPKPPRRTGSLSKRKSSNVYGRQEGATTPVARGPHTFRESFGPAAQSMMENAPFSSSRELISKQADDLAAQLGYEFEHAGVQTRSARRASSMLARTDLGGANERTTFNDVNLGLVGRKSLRRSIRHGESLGGFSDRQSFGRRRSSFQAASSIISDGTSFLDLPGNNLIDDGVGAIGIDAFDSDDFQQSSVHQPREVGFMKLKSIPYTLQRSSPEGQSTMQIITMLAPDKSTADERRSRVLSVCIMNRYSNDLTIVDIAIKPQLTQAKSAMSLSNHQLKILAVRRGPDVVDAVKLEDGFAQRLLTLTRTRDGSSLLHLEAPWSPSVRVEMPSKYKVFEHRFLGQNKTLNKYRDTGLHRTISATDIKIDTLGRCGLRDEFVLVDSEGQRHRLLLQLMPSDDLVRSVLQLTNFVLPSEQTDSLLVAWWEVKQWLSVQDPELHLEWTALVVTLFVLAVPFIGHVQGRTPANPRRKKAGVLRSSSGTAIDLEHWERMNEIEILHGEQSWSEGASWSWLSEGDRRGSSHKSPSKHTRNVSIDSTNDSRKNPFLIRCTNLAREFLQSPAGEGAMGPTGYLPTAVNKDRGTRRTALASVLIALHFLREEKKLDSFARSTDHTTIDHLGVVIAQVALWLKWPAWQATAGTYYGHEIVNSSDWLMETSVIDLLDLPAQPFDPPSIYQHIEQNLTLRNPPGFPSLLDLVSQSRSITTSHPLWKAANKLTPRLFALTSLLPMLRTTKTPKQVLELMLDCGIDIRQLSTIPDGISAAFHNAMTVARVNSLSSWSLRLRKLVGREDLDTKVVLSDIRRGTVHLNHTHDSARDYRTISLSAVEADSVSRWDTSSEFDRQTVTKLIFGEDRRFQEASKLVNQTRPPVVDCHVEPGWSEADLLEAQKELAQHVSRRTLSVAAGRGMIHYNSRIPLLTERVPIPAFTHQCLIRPRENREGIQPLTFSADKSLFTEEKTAWAFFHNGVSAGLMISRDAQWIDTSWILYNKPSELTNRHAGFLLALGLNGHLKLLAKWVAFKYLTPKHTMTSVGLLIGLAASYLGTADTLITRLMSVHVTRLLPPGAAELNLSPLTQTAGLLGIGLLYCNSQHRRMSEVMLSEIENNDSEERSGDDPILRDEGYRLAAGFSLGLINLGQGEKLHGLHDMGVVERLFTIAVGTKNVNLVHVLDRATAGAVIAVTFIFMKTNDRVIATKIDVPDTLHQFDYVRPDVFLLRTLARHLIMWSEIVPCKDFVRESLPSFYQQKADLSTTKRLSTDDLPFFNIIAGICFAISLRFAGSHDLKARDLLIEYLDQFRRLSKLPALNYDSKVTLNSVRNCLDVLALACATIMAGSGDLFVFRRLRALHGRTDPDTPFGSHLAAHMAIGTLFLSGGAATFGTSNLAIASLVIAFYPVFPTDILDNRGHLQALRHLWVLAVENRCLMTRDVETSQIISGVEARLLLKNGKVMSITTPALIPEIDNIKRITLSHESYWPIVLDLPSKPGKVKASISATAPQSESRIPIESLQIDTDRLTIPLLRQMAHEKPSTSIFEAAFRALDESRDVPSTDPHATINERYKNIKSTTERRGQDVFDWVFGLEGLTSLDHAEKSLVLNGGSASAAANVRDSRKLLSGTNVDTKLEFEMGILGLDREMYSDRLHEEKATTLSDRHFLEDRKQERDKLWQLRLLLSWADWWDEHMDHTNEEEQTRQDGSSKKKAGKVKDGENPVGDKHTTTSHGVADVSWLKREVTERLRWRVWKLAGGTDDDDKEDS